MIQLNLSFRRLLLKNIRKFTSEKLDRYESLVALRSELIHELSLTHSIVLPPVDVAECDDDYDKYIKRLSDTDKRMPIRDDRLLPNDVDETTVHQKVKTLQVQINQVGVEANKVMADFRPRFEALHSIWMSRRRLATHQGGLLQIPSTPSGFSNLWKSIWDYRIIQLRNYGIVFRGRIRDSIDFVRENATAVITGVVIIVLTAGFVYFSYSKTDPQAGVGKPNASQGQGQ